MKRAALLLAAGLLSAPAVADDREASGVKFPRSIESGAVGRPRRLRITVDTVEVNLT